MEKIILKEELPMLEPNDNNIKYTKEAIEYFKDKMCEISGIKLKSLEHNDKI